MSSVDRHLLLVVWSEEDALLSGEGLNLVAHLDALPLGVDVGVAWEVELVGVLLGQRLRGGDMIRYCVSRCCNTRARARTVDRREGRDLPRSGRQTSQDARVRRG
jgi:hypothetical protein